MEVEKIHMELEGSHPSPYNTNRHKYKDINTHYLIEEPHERFEHEEDLYLQVFEKNTLTEDASQELDLMHKYHEFPLRVEDFALQEVVDNISYGSTS